MAAIVLDASVTIAALLEEERSAEAQQILTRVAVQGACVPPLWHLEVGNILMLAERRGKLTETERLACLADLVQLPVTIDHEMATQAWRATMDLAMRHRLTLYDAAYLELAQRRGLQLATFDKSLHRTAVATGVSVV